MAMEYYKNVKNGSSYESIIWGKCLLNENKASFIVMYTVSSQSCSKAQMKIMHKVKNGGNYIKQLSVIVHNGKKFFFPQNPLITSAYLCRGSEASLLFY